MDNSNESKSFMVRFMINKGIVKDEQTGNMILTIFSIILLIISGIMMKNTLFPSTETVEEVQAVETEDVDESDEENEEDINQ